MSLSGLIRVMGGYLPDFYLIKEGTWVEIKPNMLVGPKDKEIEKLCDVVSETDQKGIVLCGFPGMSVYRTINGKNNHKEPDNCNGYIVSAGNKVSSRISINWIYQGLSELNQLKLITCISRCHQIGKIHNAFDIGMTKLAEHGVINRYKYHDKINGAKYQGDAV